MVHCPPLGTTPRGAGSMTGEPELAGTILSDGELRAVETAMKKEGAELIGP